MLSRIALKVTEFFTWAIALQFIVSSQIIEQIAWTHQLLLTTKIYGIHADFTEKFNSEELKKDKLCNQSENKENCSKKVNHTAVAMESQVAAVISLHKSIIAYNIT